MNEFKAAMVAAGHTVKAPKVSVSETVLTSKSCTGGVILSACRNRILLNQTLDERLLVAYGDMMPAIRSGLFTQSQ